MKERLLRSFIAGIVSSQFLFSHAALAKAAEPTPKRDIKTVLQDLKLETTKSFPEYFYTISKKYPDVDKTALRNLSKAMATTPFPKSNVQEFTYKGKKAYRVVSQLGSDQTVFEILQNGNDVFRINGTLFTKADTQSKFAFDKKLKTIPVFRKKYFEFRTAQFKSTPLVPSFDQWKKLNKVQRAEYYLRMRQTLEAAYKVYGNPHFKVAAADAKAFDHYAQLILGLDAFAEEAPQDEKVADRKPANVTAVGVAGAAAVGTAASGVSTTAAQQPAVPSTATIQNKAKDLVEVVGYNQINFVGSEDKSRGPSCIVAGYVKKWQGPSCPWNGDGKFFTDNPISKECNGSKAGPMIACNPLVYGFAGDGKPYCIDTRVKSGPDDFNTATHGTGPCERKSPLSSVQDKMAFIKNILSRDKELAKLSGKLSIKDGRLVTEDKESFETLFKPFQEKLLEYIDSAKTVCLENEGRFKYKDEYKPPKGKHPPKYDPAKQDDACDALMKRALAVKDLLQTGETVPPIISACMNWTPQSGVQIVGEGDKATCQCKKGWTLDSSQDNVCNPPGEEVVGEVADGVQGKPEQECTFIQRVNPVNECESSWTDWVGLTAGILGTICLVQAIDSANGGYCNHSSSSGGHKLTYVDPACPAGAEDCKGPVDPADPGTTPTDPTPPRDTETTDVQTSPVVNDATVPATR